MKSKGVFITTYFSFKDPLIQAYTLPYVKIIRTLIDKEYPIYLMTIEKYHLRLTKEEKVRIETELDLEGIKLISLNYQKFGIGLIRWIPSFFYIILLTT